MSLPLDPSNYIKYTGLVLKNDSTCPYFHSFFSLHTIPHIPQHSSNRLLPHFPSKGCLQSSCHSDHSWKVLPWLMRSHLILALKELYFYIHKSIFKKGTGPSPVNTVIAVRCWISQKIGEFFSWNQLEEFFLSHFFKHLYWSIIALQWYVSFHFITKWISYTYTYIPISLSSCVSLPPSLSHPSRWSQSTELISLSFHIFKSFLIQTRRYKFIFIVSCISLESRDNYKLV